MKQTFLEQQKRNLSQHDKISQDCYVSRVEHLTLSQYAKIKNSLCETQHKKPCTKGCKGLVKVANNILVDGFMLLKDAFLLSTPTTRTDYVTKSPSTLQTSSYNFPATETTGEICAGLVKATPINHKNPAQHFTDMKMLQEQDQIRPAFINSRTGMPKTIECIRVDRGGDEGPAHVEVQYWWTVRHIEQPTEVTMVTSRNSGASYRNRVELQNGCLTLAHANLFIPSTLNGSCLDRSGGINNEMLENNLNAAIDVYISRVDGAPCASTSIYLYKGPKTQQYQSETNSLQF